MSVLTRSALSSSFNSNLPDNTSGLITPAVLRTELVNIVDSALLTEDSASIVAEWDGTRTGDSEIIGLLSITGSLTVSGSGTLNNIGPFNQTGDSVFTGAITATGNISSSATVFGVTGSFSHLVGNSPITIGSEVTFLSASTFQASDLTITGSLTVSGSGTFNNIGPFNQTGNSIFTGDITTTGDISGSAVSTITVGGDIVGGGRGTFTNRVSALTDLVTPKILNNSSTNAGTVLIDDGLTISGNVTASSNISASGHLEGGGLKIDGAEIFAGPAIFKLQSGSGATDTFTVIRSSNDRLVVNGGSGAWNTFEVLNADLITTNISASGAITASGDINGQQIFGGVSGRIYPDSSQTSNNQFFTADANGINSNSSFTVTGNVTASANISASGNIIGNTLTISSTAVNFANLPTSDPGVVGRLYRDGGTVKVSI
jgi:hypothetical protein